MTVFRFGALFSFPLARFYTRWMHSGQWRVTNTRHSHYAKWKLFMHSKSSSELLCCSLTLRLSFNICVFFFVSSISNLIFLCHRYRANLAEGHGYILQHGNVSHPEILYRYARFSLEKALFLGFWLVFDLIEDIAAATNGSSCKKSMSLTLLLI